ncbi:sigma-70 family RNA polymerase sigma factor [Desulfovibrio aminophilus]|uniref:RNA polymerase sigma factor n=1 Tax=Desulfovibrio aminophilus TaxID=81425 RepID=UPI00339268A2
MDDDNDLIRKTLAGNTAAFGLLVARYQRPVYNLMLRAVKSADTAADLAQDTFIRAYENLERFRPGARFFSWLYAIGLNRARDWLRASRGRREAAPEELESVAACGDGGTQQDELVALLDRRRVGRALEALPLEQREALVLHYREELPLKEVAQILGISLSAAKMRVSRGLERLRRTLEVDGHV